MERNVKPTSWLDLVTGGLLTGHGIGTALRAPLHARAQRLQRRGFEPGLPHALGVPALEVVSGLGLAAAAVRRAPGGELVSIGSTIAATALAGTRFAVDLEDRSVSVTTSAAATLTLTGVVRLLMSTGRRPVVRTLTVGVAATAVAFEVARRHHILRSR
jgi:hypothetical protein